MKKIDLEILTELDAYIIHVIWDVLKMNIIVSPAKQKRDICIALPPAALSSAA